MQDKKDKLLDTIEYSGVFSNTFQDKIYEIICQTFSDIIDKKKSKHQKNIKEFNQLFETYSIFSETFKHRLSTLYLTLFNENVK